jgi:hypothetical protein
MADEKPAPEKFQWREGDIEWVVPPKSLQQQAAEKLGKKAKKTAPKKPKG